jgi:hypothetical protein
MEACQEANVKVEFKSLKMGFAVVFYRPNDDVADKAADKVEPKAKRELLCSQTRNYITDKLGSDLLTLSEVDGMIALLIL